MRPTLYTWSKPFKSISNSNTDSDSDSDSILILTLTLTAVHPQIRILARLYVIIYVGICY